MLHKTDCNTFHTIINLNIYQTLRIRFVQCLGINVMKLLPLSQSCSPEKWKTLFQNQHDIDNFYSENKQRALQDLHLILCQIIFVSK